ncbi:MAG: type II toxin-antitoxin system RelE/ParE family toxin [Armatimonadetes bacterium]|nr:type II toxin-antitoxin system RelE/ParE family toxin [Armatimonadota bacterium]
MHAGSSRGSPGSAVTRVATRIGSLGISPRPAGCHKLQDTGALNRIRIGDYRFVCSVDDEERLVDVVAVRHRSHAYR